ncbi:hypothetical protein LRR18_18275, partial [Mangrovimonas sp. AS39]|uniref:hypothetical protein n=1 Tax=Mangrovimonas futianensis TaxID=2895523 RepID=UPI001E4FB86C
GVIRHEKDVPVVVYWCMHTMGKTAKQLLEENIQNNREIPSGFTKHNSIPDWCPLRTQDITLTLSLPVSEVDKEPDDDVLI